MDRWQAEMGRVREKRRGEERRSEKRKSQKKEDAGVRKGRKVAKHCVFPMICGSGESKSRLAKAAGAEPAGKMKNCTPLWREARFQVKMYKTHHSRITFGSWDVEKMHAVVARSTFRSQNVQSTPCTDPLLDRFARQAQGIVHLVKSEQNFCSTSKTIAGVGHSKRICKDAFSVAGAVRETLELLGGEGADFLRGVTFWSIRSAGLLRWLFVTGAALRMTWHQFFVAGAVL